MSNFEKRYANLNERQKEAVEAIDGPVLVIAGPGSGKTELLGLRVANILRKTDADPGQILCLTFTDAAARNMRERLAGLIGKDAYKVAIHTFHSFGSEVINRHGECFYQGAGYSPVDEVSKTEIIEKIIKNLKWHSSLKSYHPQQGYTYLRDIANRIDDIKKGGLSPEEFEFMIIENESFEKEANRHISKAFEGRISAGMVGDLEQLVIDLAGITIAERKFPLSNYRNLKEAVLESLQETLRESEEIEEQRSKTKPITRWKKNFLKKDDGGNCRLESSFRTKDLLDLSKIYAQYQENMHKQGFYDFADMILDTVREMEKNQELRYEMQERYLYVLVDEFQDTSGVQMRLLDAMLNMEVNEGRPNILVVGDDDQSIYKFQGASLQNVNDFLRKYKDVKKIVLTHNYRSTQEILNYSKSVIERAESRLVKRDSEIIKDLVAANDKIKAGKIHQKEFKSKIEQYIFIAEEIKRLREENLDEQAAVISRRHSDLEELSTFFNYYELPVLYERNKNILEEKEVKEIIAIAKFINSLNQKGVAEAEEYLPEILSFSFFNIERMDIWRIACSCHRNRGKSWLEAMLEYGGRPKMIAEFFIALGTEAKRRPMEQVLDFVTGVKKIDGVDYLSDFKEHYFSQENFKKGRLEYLEYLFDLQALFGELRSYRNLETLYIKDLVDFVQLHETHKIPIYKSQRLSSGKNPVNLLTAHKAKGLEFDSVFIVNCNENVWMKDQSGAKLKFPINIPLMPEKDDIDDKIRIFFVAVTRAKSNLYLTNYCYADGDKKAAERLRFLDQDLGTEEIESLSVEEIRTQEEIINFTEELRHYEIKNADEKELLRSILEDYKLSATHLNNFLDVSGGGPAKFLEYNLLRFPSAQNVSSSYGTAVHNAFNEFYRRFKEKGSLPELEDFLLIFEEKLRMQKLGKEDFEEKLEKGKDELALYYEENEKNFNPADLLAVDFRSEGVMIGDCPITGEIDRISLNGEKSCKVYDYKTGKPFSGWTNRDEYLKIKASKYKDQLIFYKLLIENSRNYHKLKVDSGCIDFITAKDGKLVKLNLEIFPEDVERVRKLIEIVYGKIMALDFPDIGKYPENYKGMKEFEEDLLAGKV